MLAFLKHNLDYLTFCAISLLIFLVLNLFAKRSEPEKFFPIGVFISVFLFLFLGFFLVVWAENFAKANFQELIQGFAPTYARELERAGHSKITIDTPPDDPLYLKLINTQLRWLKANRIVDDVYTMKLHEEKVVLWVDSETDYNRDGKYEGLRESRTIMGEEYRMEYGIGQAFNGVPFFESQPMSDRWGIWVSAFEPMYDEQGKVEAILGVDFDAARFERVVFWRRLLAIAFLSLPLAIFATSINVIFHLKYQVQKRKNAEQEIKRIYDLLEARVKERTVDLANAVEVLNLQMEERRKAEENLKISLKEKESLLREIHHRVKNNLQVISSLLNLQSDSLTESKASLALQNSRDRVRSMALLHQQLYQAKDLAHIDFGEYLKELIGSLFSSYQLDSSKIGVAYKVDKIFIDIALAVPCALIVNELVTNILKHAFNEKEKGNVIIQMHEISPKNFTLTILDDGIGFPSDYDPSLSKTLGLKLVMALTEQMGGQFKIIPQQKGTCFEIKFKG